MQTVHLSSCTTHTEPIQPEQQVFEMQSELTPRNHCLSDPVRETLGQVTTLPLSSSITRCLACSEERAAGMLLIVGMFPRETDPSIGAAEKSRDLSVTRPLHEEIPRGPTS